MTRSDFDALMPADSTLRRLAADIAKLDCRQAASFLSNSSELPDNFLANADIGPGYYPPTGYSRSHLAQWKYRRIVPDLSPSEVHGFADIHPPAARGISLIFDPLVDAFLAAHLHQSGSLPQPCTVIVLSDFYPMQTGIKPHTTDDWGLAETLRTLNGIVTYPDTTTPHLFDYVTRSRDWRDNRRLIETTIASKRVLLWNFFPFFRGGNIASGRCGLPIIGHWRKQCWEFLSRFLEAVCADRVLLACSGEMLPLPIPRGDHSAPIQLNSPDKSLQRPAGGRHFERPPRLSDLTPLPPCVLKLYRLYHPYTWPMMNYSPDLIASVLERTVGNA